jgi:hypothetical protein
MNDRKYPESDRPNSPISLPSPEAIAKLRQTSREMAEWNQELAEIEAQLDRELHAQKIARISQSSLNLNE